MGKHSRYGLTRFDAAVKAVKESNPRGSKKENIITETNTSLLQSVQNQNEVIEETIKKTEQKLVATELSNVSNMTPEEFEARMNSD